MICIQTIINPIIGYNFRMQSGPLTLRGFQIPNQGPNISNNILITNDELGFNTS